MEPQHVEKAEYVSEKAVGSLRDVLEKATFSVLDSRDEGTWVPCLTRTVIPLCRLRSSEQPTARGPHSTE